MRILVDIAELEALSRLYERNTTELAGITIDLRRRLSGDLLSRVAAYGIAADAVAYEGERICDALTAHVGELEQFTLGLERVWAEASGLARDGQLVPGMSGAGSDLWWFRSAAAAPGAEEAQSHAFVAATAQPAVVVAAAAPVSPLVPVAAVTAAGATPAPSGKGVGRHFDELERLFPGLRFTSGYRSPERNAAVGGVPNSWHTRLDDLGHARAQDYVGTSADMKAGAAWARTQPSQEVLIHDVGSGLHLHVAF